VKQQSSEKYKLGGSKIFIPPVTTEYKLKDMESASYVPRNNICQVLIRFQSQVIKRSNELLTLKMIVRYRCELYWLQVVQGVTQCCDLTKTQVRVNIWVKKKEEFSYHLSDLLLCGISAQRCQTVTPLLYRLFQETTPTVRNCDDFATKTSFHGPHAASLHRLTSPET
jgi:hypothetical protein